MTSGEQCVMTPGTTLMLPWSASSWDMHILEVRNTTNVTQCVHKFLFVSLKYIAICRWYGVWQCLLWYWQGTNISG